MDMGDKSHQVCVLDARGEQIRSESIPNTKEGIGRFFRGYAGALVAMEAGTHSGWVSRMVEGLGCRVVIGNPRKLRLIWKSGNKSDERDALMLAEIARFKESLMHPIHHRGEAAQIALERIKARDVLVRTRSSLINHVRGAVKGMGCRIARCSAEGFEARAEAEIPEGLRLALLPLVRTIGELTERIRGFDRAINELSTEEYPETVRLRQVKGVGPVTALAYVLTLEDPGRFKKSRAVGAFLGLTQKRDQSGETDKQLRITKAGNDHLRRLLVGSAHYILGPFGPDCELRRYGMRIAARGGKNAKRRAVVAVARKLAVLLHRLWVSGEKYEPLRCVKSKQVA
jgi:transposase